MFKNLIKYITKKEFILLMLGGIIALFLANATNLILPTLISRIIDEYTQTQTIDHIYYYIIGGGIITGTVFTYLNTYLNALLGERIGQDLKNRLFKKILKHNYSYLVKNKPSKLLTVVNSDTIFLKNTLSQTFGLVLAAILLLIGSVVLMFSLNTKLAIIIVIVVPVVILIMFLAIKDKFKLFKLVQKQRDKLNKVISENIKANMLVKVFVSEKVEIDKFEEVNNKNKDLGLEINKVFAVVVPLVSSLSILATMIIIYFGGKEVIFDNLTIGQITAFNTYVGLFIMPMLMLAMMSTIIGQAMASLTRVNEVLNAKIQFVDGTKHIKEFKTLEVKDLNLELEEKPILKDINFRLNKGEKVGILGLTGSGKTVFLKHLLRALEPTSGEILINDENIKNYKIQDIRKFIGFSFQENFLFNDSILENIKFGRDISDAKAIKSAQIAQVEEFTKDTEEGYSRNVGEQGNNLSGGQKQRVMIARALANDPQILILDDATSRLDISTETDVFEGIRQNYKDISIILVAQKIASVKDCDRIYIFDQGEIVDNGTHEELLKSSVTYQEIELTQRNYG